jgi:hypothetical protein
VEMELGMRFIEYTSETGRSLLVREICLATVFWKILCATVVLRFSTTPCVRNGFNVGIWTVLSNQT